MPQYVATRADGERYVPNIISSVPAHLKDYTPNPWQNTYPDWRRWEYTTEAYKLPSSPNNIDNYQVWDWHPEVWGTSSWVVKIKPKNVTFSRNFESSLFKTQDELQLQTIYYTRFVNSWRYSAHGNCKGSKSCMKSKQENIKNLYRTMRQVFVRDKFYLYFQRETETQTGYTVSERHEWSPLPHCSLKKVINTPTVNGKKRLVVQ